MTNLVEIVWWMLRHELRIITECVFKKKSFTDRYGEAFFSEMFVTFMAKGSRINALQLEVSFRVEAFALFRFLSHKTSSVFFLLPLRTRQKRGGDGMTDYS